MYHKTHYRDFVRILNKTNTAGNEICSSTDVIDIMELVFTEAKILGRSFSKPKNCRQYEKLQQDQSKNNF